MPIDMRLRKLRGNTSADAMPIGPFRTYSQPVNLRDLEERFEAGDEVTPETLKAKRLIRKVSVDVKILGVGELTKKLSVTAHGFSKTARREDRGRRRHRHVAPRRARRRRSSKATRRSRRPRSRTTTPADRGRGDRRGGRARRAAARGRRMFSWLANAWRVPELRRRVLFTAMILALYRLGSWIPAPGVDSRRDRALLLRPRRDILGLLNLFSGGALSQFSAVRARDHAVRHGLDHPPAA